MTNRNRWARAVFAAALSAGCVSPGLTESRPEIVIDGQTASVLSGERGSYVELRFSTRDEVHVSSVTDSGEEPIAHLAQGSSGAGDVRAIVWPEGEWISVTMRATQPIVSVALIGPDGSEIARR